MKESGYFSIKPFSSPWARSGSIRLAEYATWSTAIC
jgi:hypothetical protein